MIRVKIFFLILLLFFSTEYFYTYAQDLNSEEYVYFNTLPQSGEYIGYGCFFDYKESYNSNGKYEFKGKNRFFVNESNVTPKEQIENFKFRFIEELGIYKKKYTICLIERGDHCKILWLKNLNNEKKIFNNVSWITESDYLFWKRMQSNECLFVFDVENEEWKTDRAYQCKKIYSDSCWSMSLYDPSEGDNIWLKITKSLRQKCKTIEEKRVQLKKEYDPFNITDSYIGKKVYYGNKKTYASSWVHPSNNRGWYTCVGTEIVFMNRYEYDGPHRRLQPTLMLKMLDNNNKAFYIPVKSFDSKMIDIPNYLSTTEEINNLKKNEIFIKNISIETYSNNREKWHMYITMSNTFDKVIKYVDVTVTAYNRVGDIQKDYYGKNSKSVRFIGPVSVFDNFDIYSNTDPLFIDRNNVIEKVQLTKVVITFMDGSTKVYDGKEIVNKHRYL